MRAFQKMWRKLLLRCYIRGIVIPGIRGALAQLDPNERAAVDREILVREIKGRRVVLGRGPLGWRRASAVFISFFFRYRGLAGLGFKILVGVFLTLLPITTFIIVRGILPVPARVPFGETQKKHHSVSVLKTSFPYTVELLPNHANVGVVNFLSLEGSRATVLSLDSDAHNNPGMMRFSVGSYPARMQEFRGFLVAEGAPIALSKRTSESAEVLGRNRMAIRSYLLPSSERLVRCRLEIRDDEGKLLVASEAEAPHEQGFSRRAIGAEIRERLLPASSSGQRRIEDFSIEIDRLPSSLSLSVFRIGDTTENSFPSLTAVEVLKRVPQWASSLAHVRDVSAASCIYGVGRFEFEKQIVRPLTRRGVVLVAVDGLRQSLAERADVMPNLHSFARERGIWFRNHFSQSSDAGLAMSAMWTSSFPLPVLHSNKGSEFERPKFSTQMHLARYFQDFGFRGVAIGHVTGEDTSAWEDVVAIENRHYETRSITEEAGKWLDANGDVPFFLYLHYGTLKSPFRPPFEDFSALRFLRSPMGLDAETELELGLARFWDKEFGLLLQKLESAGILGDVDLVVTGSRGNQQTPMSYGMISQGGFGGKWAARSQSLLTRDELHVPLIMALSGIAGNRTVLAPTAHMDIAPTFAKLYGFRGSRDWQGLDLLPVIVRDKANELQKRTLFYASSKTDAAVFMAHGLQEKCVLHGNHTAVELFGRAFPWRRSAQVSGGKYFLSTTANGSEDFVRDLPFSVKKDLGKYCGGEKVW